MGEIHLSAPTTTVFRMGSTVEGTVRLELTEVIPGSRLVVHFWASQESYNADTRTVRSDGDEGAPHGAAPELRTRKTIYEEKYVVAGEQLYEDGDTFPFRVLIPPQVRYVMSEEIARNSFSDSLSESSTQTTTISSRLSSPIEWRLMAYLTVPGRLSMDSKVVKIHVEPPLC